MKQISEYVPANNSFSDDKSSRQRQRRHCSSSTAQHPRSNCSAQPSKPLGVSRTRSNQPTCTKPPATLAVVRGIPLSEASRSRGAACLNEQLLEKEPSIVTRIEHTQHTTHHKTKTTQRNTQTTSTSTANPTTAQLAGGKRTRDSSYPGVLCGQRAEGLTSFVARSRSCSLVLRLQFSMAHLFCLVCARRSAWPELLQFTTVLFLAGMPTFRGWKLNRVEGQSCCAAVLTARLRHTEGGKRPRGILHMKRVCSTKHSIFLPVFVLAVCSSSHSMGRGGSFSEFLPTHADS